MKKRFFCGWRLAVLGIAALAVAFLSLLLGSEALSVGQVIGGIFRTDPQSVASRILWAVRLPQTAACALAGAALAISGLLLQTATGNPLAGPNVIGVNAGAGFAMVLGLCFAPMAYALLPLWCFLGAFGAALLILFVANRVGASRVSLVLSGVAVSSLLSAGISGLRLLYPELTVGYSAFSAGGVEGVTLSRLAVPAVIVAAVFMATLVLAPRLELLCLGDPLAASLGLRVRRIRVAALLLASAAAGAAVSFAGLLGFVGLMVPHISRKLLGRGSVGKNLPACALLGATLVMAADLLGRVAFAPSQLPAGIITAVLGAPFFFILLLQRRNRL